MKKIYKIEEIPEQEQIYLSKNFLGWKVVHPIKNEDGSYNWFNLLIGGWENLIIVLFVILLLVVFYLTYKEVSSQLVYCINQLNSRISFIP